MSAPANTVRRTRPTAAPARRARAKLFGGLGFYAFVVAFVVFCLAPFVWTFLTSLKGPTTIYEVPIRYLPSPPDLVNYREIFELERFRWALLNSTIVASSRDRDLAGDRFALRLRHRAAQLPRSRTCCWRWSWRSRCSRASRSSDRCSGNSTPGA